MRLYINCLLLGIGIGWVMAEMLFVEIRLLSKGRPSIRRPPTLLGHGQPQTGPIIPAFDKFTDVSQFVERIHSASQEELKRWILSWKDSLPPSELVEIAISHYASLDPDAAFNFLIANEELPEFLLEWVVNEWGRTDPMAALDTVLGADPEGALVGSIVYNLGAVESENLYQDLLRRGYDQTHPERFFKLFWSFRGMDPAMAAKRAHDFGLKFTGTETESVVLDLMGDMFRKWHQTDAGAALEWGMAQWEAGDAAPFVNDLIRSATETDGVKALERIWPQLTDEQRYEYRMEIQFSDKHLDEMLNWIDANVESPALHTDMMMSALRSISDSKDPKRTADLLSRLDIDLSNEQYNSFIVGTCRKWAEADSESMISWAESLEDSPLREAAFSGLLAQCALEDPLQAIDKWHANSDMFPDSIDPTIFLRAVFRSPGLRDPEDIIMRLPESVRDQAVMAYASEYAAQAPEETFHVVAGQPPGVERDRALQLSLSHWASEEPNEVAAWVTTLEEGEQRKLSTLNLATNWARHDLAAASDWVENLPPSPSRDAAAQEVVNWLENDPERALSLAQTMSDSDARNSHIHALLIHVARSDPDFAESQLRSVDLPTSVRVQAMQSIEAERLLQESFK